MTQITIEVRDHKAAASLLHILANMEFVSILETKAKENKTEAQRDCILSYAGSWSSMPATMWKQLQTVLQHDTLPFPERNIIR